MTETSGQNYANHRRFVPGYHYLLSLLAVLVLAGSSTLVYRSFSQGEGRLAAIVIFVLAICIVLEGYYLRIFALKAQDRAIRVEENLRHFSLHGSLLDSRLDTRQVIGLRFAADGELGALAKRAAEEGLSEEAIKRAVENWRSDTYRV